jgi:hypothetical protein
MRLNESNVDDAAQSMRLAASRISIVANLRRTADWL